MQIVAEWSWVVGLVAVFVVPLWIIIWWIPNCDRVGVEKARRRENTQGIVEIK
jgi:hypothetical protein